MKESDLYLPLKRYLKSQDYEVKGEVGNCDVMAIRNGESPVIVELKLSLNLTVILQCVDRLSISSTVYIGIPKQCKTLKRQSKQIIKLLKMLGLGLITIDPKKGNVVTLLDPSEYTPRKSKHREHRLLGEFAKRVGDPNLGGVDKKKGIMTAYRQSALAIAQFLKEHGPSKASDIAKSIQEPKSRTIMYRDVYGWFERVSQGIYDLSPRGRQELLTWLAEE